MGQVPSDGICIDRQGHLEDLSLIEPFDSSTPGVISELPQEGSVIVHPGDYPSQRLPLTNGDQQAALLVDDYIPAAESIRSDQRLSVDRDRFAPRKGRGDPVRCECCSPPGCLLGQGDRRVRACRAGREERPTPG